MGAKTKIEWVQATWTPIRARNVATGKVGWHCEKVSPGCEHCYSATTNFPYGTGAPFKPGILDGGAVRMQLDTRMLTAPRSWSGRNVFVCSMTDLFGRFVPDGWLNQIFAEMEQCTQHTYHVLTKRPERMRE